MLRSWLKKVHFEKLNLVDDLRVVSSSDSIFRRTIGTFIAYKKVVPFSSSAISVVIHNVKYSSISSA